MTKLDIFKELDDQIKQKRKTKINQISKLEN